MGDTRRKREVAPRAGTTQGWMWLVYVGGLQSLLTDTEMAKFESPPSVSHIPMEPRSSNIGIPNYLLKLKLQSADRFKVIHNIKQFVCAPRSEYCMHPNTFSVV